MSSNRPTDLVADLRDEAQVLRSRSLIASAIQLEFAADKIGRLQEAIFKAKAELAAGHQITAAHILELAS